MTRDAGNRTLRYRLKIWNMKIGLRRLRTLEIDQNATGAWVEVKSANDWNKTFLVLIYSIHLTKPEMITGKLLFSIRPNLPHRIVKSVILRLLSLISITVVQSSSSSTPIFPAKLRSTPVATIYYFHCCCSQLLINCGRYLQGLLNFHHKIWKQCYKISHRYENVNLITCLKISCYKES